MELYRPPVELEFDDELFIDGYIKNYKRNVNRYVIIALVINTVIGFLIGFNSVLGWGEIILHLRGYSLSYDAARIISAPIIGIACGLLFLFLTNMVFAFFIPPFMARTASERHLKRIADTLEKKTSKP